MIKNKIKEKKKYLSDFMGCFKKIRIELEEYNKILIQGSTGTGKTGFILDYFDKPDINLNIVDKETTSKEIISYLHNGSLFYDQNVVIYDDITIKPSILKEVGIYLKNSFINRKFIVLVEKIIRGNFFMLSRTGFVKVETIYPNKQVLLRYIDYMREYTKINYSRELISTLLNLKPKDMRRIEFSLVDGYFSGVKKKKEEKYHITKSGSFILSLGIAENLPRLRRLKDSIIDADKLKRNERFYLDYLKCFYPKIEKTRLRYPKELLEIVKIRKK